MDRARVRAGGHGRFQRIPDGDGKPADVTLFWIFGNGAVPFVQQYNDYGLTAALAAPMSNNFSDAQLAELGDHRPGHARVRLLRLHDRQPAEQGLHRRLSEAVSRRVPDSRRAMAPGRASCCTSEGLKATDGDTTPAKVIEAMSNMTPGHARPAR